MSPWADLTLSGDSINAKAALDPVLTPEGLARRAADYLGDSDPSPELVSPIFADLTGLPPLLIQAGSHEILLDDATRLAAHAAAADVAVTLEITPGVPHVFEGFAAMLDEGDAALTAAGDFLRAPPHCRALITHPPSPARLWCTVTFEIARARLQADTRTNRSSTDMRRPSRSRDSPQLRHSAVSDFGWALRQSPPEPPTQRDPGPSSASFRCSPRCESGALNPIALAQDSVGV